MHTIIDINEKKSLEDIDISYKESISEFDEIFKKIKDTKQSIEEEIEVINKTHKKIEDEISASFEKQLLALNQKENKLKLELGLKITEIKNDLEKFFGESNNISLSCERLNKSITTYERKTIIEK